MGKITKMLSRQDSIWIAPLLSILVSSYVVYDQGFVHFITIISMGIFQFLIMLVHLLLDIIKTLFIALSLICVSLSILISTAAFTVPKKETFKEYLNDLIEVNGKLNAPQPLPPVNVEQKPVVYNVYEKIITLISKPTLTVVKSTLINNMELCHENYGIYREVTCLRGVFGNKNVIFLGIFNTWFPWKELEVSN